MEPDEGQPDTGVLTESEALAAWNDEQEQEEPVETAEQNVNEEVPEGTEQPEETDPDESEVDFDGEKLTLKELKEGYLRDREYKQRTQEVEREKAQVAEQRQSVVTRSQELEYALTSLGSFLEKHIAPHPPAELLQTNPTEYFQRKEMREAGIRQLQELLTVSEEVKRQNQAAVQRELEARKSEESAKLVRAMPHLADPVKRAFFEQAVTKTAKEFGFTDAEIATTADHRVMQMIHYANIGKRAEINQKNAKKRVESAPKTATPMRPAPVQAQQQAKAIERLTKTGRLQDAMKIDFA